MNPPLSCGVMGVFQFHSFLVSHPPQVRKLTQKNPKYPWGDNVKCAINQSINREPLGGREAYST